MPGGFAALIDRAGNDHYYCKGRDLGAYGTPGIFAGWGQGCGVGFRGIASGGVALMLDESGNDVYEAGNFSQGGGYYFGWGALVGLSLCLPRWIERIWLRRWAVIALAILWCLPYLHARTSSENLGGSFLALGIAAFARIVAFGLDARRAAGLGAFIGLAVATKEQAAAIFLAVPLALILFHLRQQRERRVPTTWRELDWWRAPIAFGLTSVHSFGFASGLSTTGMPSAEIPLALLMFNIGVEIGQLAFVILMLLAYRSLRTLEFRWPRWVDFMPGYLIGSLGAFWTIQRTAMMF